VTSPRPPHSLGPMSATPPLAGVKVVEITSIYSGPLAGVLLAELGADVVKVESQGKPDLIRNQRNGPYGVAPVFYALNRGKRFVSVDANTPRGRQLLFDLVADADVFLHNIRPGKPEALGLDYAELSERNPGLIYVGISGMGHDGPDSAQPVYDYVVQARTGIVDYQRDLATGKASLISQVVVDKTTAQACVQAVLASLYVREKTGKGQRIDVPMIGVGLHFEWPDAMAPTFSEVDPPVPADQLPVHLTMMPAATLIVIVTGDGGEIACSPQLPPFDGFAIALDRPDWIVDERFSEGLIRAANFPAFHAEVVEAAKRFTKGELLARMRENGVASGPVQRRADVHHDEQIVHLGLITEQDTGFIGRVRQPHPMWHFSETPAAITTSMGRTGEHTREVLRERGYDDATIESLLNDGAIAQP
jgi:crotonobetainyl-CoA:carnitine CoA-transferase CaiB-like acyl-CoA transferase